MPDYDDLIEESRRKIRRYENKIYDDRSEIRSNEGKISTDKSDKKNLEKRLKQVEQIIRYINTDVDNSFTAVSNKAGSAQNKYEDIKSSGINRGNIFEKYKVPSVHSDSAMNNALALLKREKELITENIKRIEREIRSLENTIQNLKRSIASYENSIDDLKINIRNYNNM